MKKLSVADIVFLMIAGTICYLTIRQTPIDALFYGIAGTVFGAFYTHKAGKQQESVDSTNKSSEN